MSFHGLVAHFFLTGKNIPVCGCIIVYLSLVDLSLISWLLSSLVSFEQSCNKSSNAKTEKKFKCYILGRHKFLIILGKYEGA